MTLTLLGRHTVSAKRAHFLSAQDEMRCGDEAIKVYGAN